MRDDKEDSFADTGKVYTADEIADFARQKIKEFNVDGQRAHTVILCVFGFDPSKGDLCAWNGNDHAGMNAINAISDLLQDERRISSVLNKTEN